MFLNLSLRFNPPLTASGRQVRFPLPTRRKRIRGYGGVARRVQKHHQNQKRASCEARFCHVGNLRKISIVKTDVKSVLLKCR